MIQKQKRREYVAAVEDKLRQPLAQYQQYMNYMPAELFEKLLSVLDPKKDTPKIWALFLLKLLKHHII